VPDAGAGLLVDVPVQVECDPPHAVLAQRHVAAHEIMLLEYAPHADLLEVRFQVALDIVMVT